MKKLSFIFLAVMCFTQAAAQYKKNDNHLLEELTALRNRNFEQQDSIRAIQKKIEAQKDSVSVEERRSMDAQLAALKNAMAATQEAGLYSIFEFVKQNPHSLVSVEILLNQFYRWDGDYYDAFLSLYRRMHSAVQKSENGKKLANEFYYYRNSKTGKKAPPFHVKDIEDHALSLQDYLGKKYVLIDFWASWCVPCRQDFPFLKSLYQNFATKGLEIIQISTDGKLEEWRKAIIQDEISQWRHFAIKVNTPGIQESYFVSAIPVKLLIDKEGRIIGRWRGGGEPDKNAELEKLLQTHLK
jgi:peroxiredoxin